MCKKRRCILRGHVLSCSHHRAPGPERGARPEKADGNVMIFGILKDIKEEEFRVICTPMEVHSIRAAGHEVWAQHDCGKLAGFADEAYAAAGARIVETAEEMFAGCDMVAKVKEYTPA